MKLYAHPMSTCTRKVLCCLAEKGQKAEFIMVDIMKGEGRNPDHLGRQPFGKVPAFEDDGFALYESRAICRYLDEKFPTPKLHGTDLKSRAVVEQWISIESSNFSGPAMKIVMAALFAPMGGHPVDEAAIAEGRIGVQKCVEVMERQLKNHAFIAGDHFTIADICFMPYIDYLFAAKQGDLFESPAVAAWWKKISERPSWKTATGG